MCKKTEEWYNQIDLWKKSYTKLVNMRAFQGQSATAVKAYLEEVHEVIIQSIYVAISRLQSEYLLYKRNYYNIEDNIYAKMSQEAMESIKTNIYDKKYRGKHDIKYREV